MGALVGVLGLLTKHFISDYFKKAKKRDAENRDYSSGNIKEIARLVDELKKDNHLLKYQIQEHSKTLIDNTLKLAHLESQLAEIGNINMKILTFFGRQTDESSQVTQIGKDTFLVRKKK